MEKNSTNEPRVIIQPRDKRLFDALTALRLVDVGQARQVADFNSTSRAKARLLALHRAGYLDRFFVGTISGGRKAIYSLARTRRRREERPIASAQTERFVDHQLTLNDIYLSLSGTAPALASWERCTEAIPDRGGVIPDARADIDDSGRNAVFFVEVDLGTESRSVWERKIAGYLRLARSGYCADVLGVPSFRALVIARSEDRIAAIRNVIAKSTDRIFWLASIQSIKRDGFWAAIWLRPTGDQRLSLR